MDFIQHIIPTSLFSALTEGNVPVSTFVALLADSQPRHWVRRANRSSGDRASAAVDLQILVMVLWLAPIGAFG